MLLHRLCLTRSRTAAAHQVAAGDIEVNGQPARAAQPVRLNDRITLLAGRRRRTYEIVRLTDRGVSRAAAAEYYRLVADEEI